jgi:hypothetical protein
MRGGESPLTADAPRKNSLTIRPEFEILNLLFEGQFVFKPDAGKPRTTLAPVNPQPPLPVTCRIPISNRSLRMEKQKAENSIIESDVSSLFTLAVCS